MKVNIDHKFDRSNKIDFPSTICRFEALHFSSNLKQAVCQTEFSIKSYLPLN